MTRSSRLRAIVVLLVSGLALAQEPPLSPRDVLSLQSVIQVVPAPGGKAIAFRRLVPRRLDEAPGAARAHLFWLDLETGRERRLIGGERSVSSIAFSPDGSAVTFVDRPSGAPHPEVWALPLNGGEAVRITSTPHGVETYRFRPGSDDLAFTRTRPVDDDRAQAQKLGFRPRVVDEDWQPIDLHYWSAASGETKLLMAGGAVNDFAWSPDGRRLVCAVAPRNLIDDSYMGNRLVEVDLGEAEVSGSLSTNHRGKLGEFAVSPRGDAIAWIGAADIRDPHAGMLFVKREDDTTARCLTNDLEGMVHDVHWTSDTRLLATVSLGLATHVVAFDLTTGKHELLAGGMGASFRSIARGSGDAARVYAHASTATHPDEVFEISLLGGETRRLTDSNPWLASRRLGRQIAYRFRARDGLTIEGLLIHPTTPASGPSPLVILAHGGPEAHYSEGWLTRYSEPGQVLAGRGYVVWYPNYRSSTGRGVAFAKQDHGDPMGKEFDDHLDAISALSREGLVDPQRVGIAGGSYGGYTAAWAATRHSEQFAAAVSFVPFVDLRTKWFTTDIPNEFFHVHYEEKWPHQQIDFLAERSPLTWAPNCKTPLLLAGGDADPRVHPSQPFMLYRAVKTSTATPVRYVQYSGEGHGNRIDRNQLDLQLRLVRWFDHYLAEGAQRDAAPPPPDIDYTAQ